MTNVNPSYGSVNMANLDTVQTVTAEAQARRNKAWSNWSSLPPGNGAKKSQ